MFSVEKRDVTTFPEFPLLCKEGPRGGRSLRGSSVGSTLQLIASNGITLPNPNPPIAKGWRFAEQHFGKSPVGRLPWKALNCQRQKVHILMGASFRKLVAFV